MYLFSTVIKESKIDGRGVFANQDILKGEIVWKYVKTHDKALSQDDYIKLGDEQKEYLSKGMYLSKESGFFIYPPENDPAWYTNHDHLNHNLSVVVDKNISTEPFFIANRDIKLGEELTNNYHEFDEAIKITEITPSWLS
jgi:SET domain-containing protein